MKDKTAYNREYHKKWYANPENAARQKANARMHTEANRRRNLQFIEDYKSKHPCPCGESHSSCLDFHHADSTTKQAVVSDLARRAVSLATLAAEIRKCTVLCRNCLAKLHHDERQRGAETNGSRAFADEQAPWPTTSGEIPGIESSMTMTIELTPAPEGLLEDEAACQGRTPADFARSILEERLMERNRATVALLDRWAAEDTAADSVDESWPELREALEAERAPDERKLFCE